MAKRKLASVYAVELSSQDYLHGKLLSFGARQALLVRTEEDSWTWFPYRDCRQLLLGFKREDTNRSAAYRDAVAYVQHGALPVAPAGVNYRVSNEQDELVVKYLQELLIKFGLQGQKT